MFSSNRTRVYPNTEEEYNNDKLSYPQYIHDIPEEYHEYPDFTDDADYEEDNKKTYEDTTQAMYLYNHTYCNDPVFDNPFVSRSTMGCHLETCTKPGCDGSCHYNPGTCDGCYLNTTLREYRTDNGGDSPRMMMVKHRLAQQEREAEELTRYM